MEVELKKVLETQTVKRTVDRLHLHNDELINIWFDAGIEYIEILKTKIRRKRNFDRLFKPLLRNREFGKLGVTEVFTTIRHSTAFWDWWSSQLWRICRNGAYQDETELFYRLQFNSQFIPPFILKRIFNGKQEHARKPGSENAPKTPAHRANAEKRPAGERAKSRV